MLILAVDVETTGLDPKVDEVTEFAGVLWDTNIKTYAFAYTTLVCGSLPVSAFITKLTGITNDMRVEFGVTANECSQSIARLAERADCFMAHNAEFDKAFIYSMLDQAKIDYDKTQTWIDTKSDIPQKGRSSALTYAAADHGFINPFPHRAITDVFTMLTLANHYDLGEALTLAQSPHITLVAEVPYEDREKARTAGFHWDKRRKLWIMRIRSAKASTMNFDFPVSYLAEDDPKPAEETETDVQPALRGRKKTEDAALDETFASDFKRR